MWERFRKQLHTTGEAYLRIKARPGAAATEVREIMADDTVKIDLAAAPERGRANEELVRFLAAEFGVAKENVRILSGAGERTKLVKIVTK